MSENGWIVLIIAATVVTVLFMFRGTLARFFFKAGSSGIEAVLEAREQATTNTGDSGARPTRPPGQVTISGNRQIGRRNEIDVSRPDVDVTENLQLGTDQEIAARLDQTPEENE
jgi:hypothetical protein